MKVQFFSSATLKLVTVLVASITIISCTSISARLEPSTQLGDELLANTKGQSDTASFKLGVHIENFLKTRSSTKFSNKQVSQVVAMYKSGTLSSVSQENFDVLSTWKDKNTEEIKTKLGALLLLFPNKANSLAEDANYYNLLGNPEIIELVIAANLDPTLIMEASAAGEESVSSGINTDSDNSLVKALPKLSTSDNKFVQPDGTAVTLKGVSLCSLAWHKPLDQIAQVTHPLTGWNPKILRLPVQPRMWEIEGASAYMRKRLDPAIELCNENGVYCIIDWHKIGNWTDPDVNGNLMDFWEKVAPRYANNPNVLYEVFNEPTKPKARTQENWDAYREYAQTWVDHIRNFAPETVILIGSPHWSQSTSFAVSNPVIGENIGYVTHVYPLWKPSRWDGLFGNAAEDVPMVLTEWGWSSVNQNPLLHSSVEGFGEPLKEYLDAKPHIGWTAWSYDPRCGPAMLGKDSDMAEFVKYWLLE